MLVQLWMGVLVRMLRVALAGLVLIACVPEESAPLVLVPVPGESVRYVMAVGGAPPRTRGDIDRIQVLPVKRPDRPAEVVGVVDAHVPMGDHGRALAVLRAKAADMGADAVIGVDFEHGAGHDGEPMHLSGLAIRYLGDRIATDRTHGEEMP